MIGQEGGGRKEERKGFWEKEWVGEKGEQETSFKLWLSFFGLLSLLSSSSEASHPIRWKL